MADADVPPAAPPPPRLLCDGTLGALCRWLRAAGYDTEFLAPQRRLRRDEPSQAHDLLQRAAMDERLILTRSRRIHALVGAERACVVKDDVVFHQVLEVARALGLNLTRHALSRCREDNGLLAPVAPGEVHGRVPPYVAATQKDFMGCPRCGRVYWGATHRDSMLERLAELEQLRLGMGAPLSP
jgi:uncharacterized protein with PIN domain